jgi:hypothetical protein
LHLGEPAKDLAPQHRADRRQTIPQIETAMDITRPNHDLGFAPCPRRLDQMLQNVLSDLAR